MSNNHLTAFIAVIALAFSTSSIHAEFALAYQLPDTGQTLCYDGTGNVIACPNPGEPFYGQDSQYLGPQPSFVDNTDGTVSDLNTGLMWQQGDAQNTSPRTWVEAVDYCSGLNLGLHTDWRLPNRLELMSIVDYGRWYPPIDTSYFPNCLVSGYWTNSTYAHDPGTKAWGVVFYSGFVVAHDKGTKSSYVRCVRTTP